MVVSPEYEAASRPYYINTVGEEHEAGKCGWRVACDEEIVATDGDSDIVIVASTHLLDWDIVDDHSEHFMLNVERTSCCFQHKTVREGMWMISVGL